MYQICKIQKRTRGLSRYSLLFFKWYSIIEEYTYGDMKCLVKFDTIDQTKEYIDKFNKELPKDKHSICYHT